MTLFITLEGGEGVGKSTNLAFIESYLLQKNIELITTREPGGTDFAEKIRELVLAPRQEAVDPLTELLLIFAARNQHLKQKVEPALAQGKLVLCDRFVDATYAYQGYGRGFDLGHIAQLESLVTEGRKPDFTLFLDAPVEVGMERARARGNLDRFEQEQNSFFEKVRNGYKKRVEQDPGRFAVINCAQPLELVQQQIQHALDSFFHQRTL